MKKSKYAKSYEKQAEYYDAIYEVQGKDYEKESKQIHSAIEKYKKSKGSDLLDIGCGTGGHFPYLEKWYKPEGLDIDLNMLKVARKRFPKITLHQGDMTNFNVGKKFDVITCLFSAIGYAITVENLNATIKCFKNHVKPGGVIIVEPWFSPDNWTVGRPSAVFVNKPDLKLARVNISGRKGNISIVDFHFLVATQGKIDYFTELHEIGLFTKDEYLNSFTKSDLQVIFDPEGITGRGLYIGINSL